VKAGALVGRSLDDAGLIGSMRQLERMGLASGFEFRTAAGRERYSRLSRPVPHQPKPDRTASLEQRRAEHKQQVEQIRQRAQQRRSEHKATRQKAKSEK